MTHEFRSRIIACVLVAVFVPFLVYMICYSAVLPGLNEQSDKAKESIERRDELASTIEGSITDRRGDVITFAEEPGVPAHCVFQSYGQLVGYNSTIYGRSGLRNRFSDHLFTGDDDHKGATITLTTINAVQCAAYDLIRGTDGAVVVLENDTGRIIALATSNAQAELDVNDLSNWDQLGSIEGFFIPNWKVSLAPGSVAKAMFSTAVVQSGKADYVYHDTGRETVMGHSFRNAGGAAYGNVTLRDALVHSVNTYYAHIAGTLGVYKLANTAEAFGIGQDIELDFTTISSAHNLTNAPEVEAAAACFGQGKLLLSPMNMAMIGQALANDGKMLTPYLIESISNGDGVIHRGKTTVFSQSTDIEAARQVTEYMKDAAVSYGFDPELGIAAKTGTAELGTADGLNRAAFLSFNDKYTVVVVENNTTKAGKRLAPIALTLFDILHQEALIQ